MDILYLEAKFRAIVAGMMISEESEKLVVPSISDTMRNSGALDRVEQQQ